MHLAPYVDRLHHELAASAEAAGEDARALAERLVVPLDSTARLVLLEALSTAAVEITRDLAPGSVELRLRGRDPCFVVTPPPGGPAVPPGSHPSALSSAFPPAAPPADGEESGTSRISLRVPDPLKHRIETAAGGEGLSVNAWLVRAAGAALDRDGGRRHTGWVR
ncbi:hypothetical protein [Nonomuraea sp. NPDC003754]